MIRNNKRIMKENKRKTEKEVREMVRYKRKWRRK
jgi:hypothetical protein